MGGYLVAHFTHQAIVSTFDEMITEMPFDKITVSALVKRCAISTNTFYYHFKDIYDLLDVWMQTEMGTFMSIDMPYEDWTTSAKLMLEHCKEKKPAVMHVYNSVSRDSLEQYLFNRSNDLVCKYVSRYSVGKQVPQEKLDELAEFFRLCLVSHFLRFLWTKMSGDRYRLDNKQTRPPLPRRVQSRNAALAGCGQCGLKTRRAKAENEH